MASVTLQVGQTFPAGTTVGAYPATGWAFGQLPPSGAPAGTAKESATVSANTTLAYSALDDNVSYYAAGQVAGAWRYLAFQTGVPASGGGGTGPAGPAGPAGAPGTIVAVSATAPASPATGDLWVDTS